MVVKLISVEPSCVVHANSTGIRFHTKIGGDINQAEKESFIHNLDPRRPIFYNAKSHTPVKFDVE